MTFFVRSGLQRSPWQMARAHLQIGRNDRACVRIRSGYGTHTIGLRDAYHRRTARFPCTLWMNTIGLREESDEPSGRIRLPDGTHPIARSCECHPRWTRIQWGDHLKTALLHLRTMPRSYASHHPIICVRCPDRMRPVGPSYASRRPIICVRCPDRIHTITRSFAYDAPIVCTRSPDQMRSVASLYAYISPTTCSRRAPAFAR
jgi:hypothetical protein